MKSRCPYCGKVEELPPEYFKQQWCCGGCRREYVVGVVRVTNDMFTNNVAKILCPHCGQRNDLPLAAVNMNVSCGACDETIYTYLTPSTSHNTSVRSSRRCIKIFLFIITVISGVVLVVWKAASILRAFRSVTGTDLGLGEHIYDNEDCELEIEAALCDRDLLRAMKWANRIRDERIREITISKVRSKWQALMYLDSHPQMW